MTGLRRWSSRHMSSPFPPSPAPCSPSETMAFLCLTCMDRSLSLLRPETPSPTFKAQLK